MDADVGKGRELQPGAAISPAREFPRLEIDVDGVHRMIRGSGDAGMPLPDPIECLKQAEGPAWKLDCCAFLLKLALEGNHAERERSYLAECAAMSLASVFDVLLHEVAHYYGLDAAVPPKDVRWSSPFVPKLQAQDSALAQLLAEIRQEEWFRRLLGLRHYVTHHAGLLQHVAIGQDGRDYSVTSEEFFDESKGILRPRSLELGYIDRERLIAELIELMDKMCGVVDRVRLHCFDHAPAFHWGRVRRDGA